MGKTVKKFPLRRATAGFMRNSSSVRGSRFQCLDQDCEKRILRIFDYSIFQSSNHWVMKEVIVKYKDSRVLELLKSLAKYFDFTISGPKETKGDKNVSFTALKIDTRGFKFNRDEANER